MQNNNSKYDGSLLDKLQIVYESFLEADNAKRAGYILGLNMLQILREDYPQNVLESHIKHINKRNYPEKSEIAMSTAIKLNCIETDMQDLAKGKISFYFANLTNPEE